jgi:hypothetical protein
MLGSQSSGRFMGLAPVPSAHGLTLWDDRVYSRGTGSRPKRGTPARGPRARTKMASPMEAPAVHYANTSDGLRIAYGAIGAGDPLVYMPWATSNFADEWRMYLDATSPAFGDSPLSIIPRSARSFATRFRCIQYDARGQGLSARGLPQSHSITD